MRVLRQIAWSERFQISRKNRFYLIVGSMQSLRYVYEAAALVTAPILGYYSAAATDLMSLSYPQPNLVREEVSVI